MSALHDGKLAYGERLHSIDYLAQSSARVAAHEGARLPRREHVAHGAQARALLEKAVFAHPIVIEDFRQVFVTRVGEADEDARRAGTLSLAVTLDQACSVLHGSGNRRPSRPPHK